jgi:hypothetical protein
LNNLPFIEISWGEFFDRLTILEIKLENISDKNKRTNVQKSLDSLFRNGKDVSEFPESVQLTYHKLKAVNQSLWTIEDEKRNCERRKDFGPEFIRLARSVYIKNDLRAQLKRDIDLILESKLIEVKSHDSY